MATIRTRKTSKGETRHTVIVRLKGHPQETATFARLTDAKKWEQNTESAIREGRYFKSAEARRHTFADMIEKYKLDVLPRKSENMQKKQSSQLDWWKEKLGPYTLADVTPARITEARDELARTEVRGGTSRSPASVNRYLAALSHAFSIAMKEWGWIEHSPMKKVGRFKEPRGRVRFLSDDERKRLFEVCRKSKEPLLFPIVVLAASTGARDSEILNLRWGDIDFQRNLAITHDTKNEERRALPLAGLALEELTKLSQVRRIDTDLVFPDRSGTRPIRRRKPWEEAVKVAQLENFKFHDLRHTAASYLAMNGATLAELAEILGHKTLQMVKRYAHLTEQHTSKVVAKMNEKMFSNQS